ncbi:hypothetical protein GIB67_004246, partial [Kingdonia uniflora]
TYTVDFSYPGSLRKNEVCTTCNRTRERERRVVFYVSLRSCFYRESLPNGSLFIQTCGTCP